MAKIAYLLMLMIGLVSCKIKTNNIADRIKENKTVQDAAGCVTDMQSMNAIDRKNKKTYAAIEKRYGKDWKIKYEKDLEDAAMKQTDIMDILIVNRPFRDQIKNVILKLTE
ncbi:hypothetical protein P2W68_05905 [Chryseobacterium arthrosphaerae]|uniref:FEKKY domain-containing protein n=1 Tax=Chryseobacterium arthrosphaerae TaxID=651561 RepID=UPI0023E11200|nr:hypothetical protein [Chryseobacterium arthrosphaerae]WES99150.1 hypothetical protein P2W68_05905 [Chryseobacterium arthrosphaerae]